MHILDLIISFFFGVVQGVTEWLPISSTGHMILFEQFFPFRHVSPEFMSMFRVVIQFGSILAVVFLYWHKIFPFNKKEGKVIVRKDIFIMWFKIIVACIPAAIVGVLFDDKIDAMFYNWQCVSIMLILFGIIFIAVEYRNEGRKPKITSISQITYSTAAMIGVFQLIAAVFPGTSRSGATIVGALIIGVSRKTAAEFTFFLAIPVMLGASLLKMFKFGLNFSGNELAILIVGMITAFFVSVFVIKFLMNYIKKHDFKVFGWYRIVLGVLVIIYFAINTLAK